MKQCKKCKAEKELTEFYVHSEMADGHLNFCIDCVKERIRNANRSEWGREYDKLRNQTPKRKKWLIEYQRKRRLKFPNKDKAKQKLNNAIRDGRIKRRKCKLCDYKIVQGHHPDYSKPLKVIWLCPEHHRKIHKQFQRKYP